MDLQEKTLYHQIHPVKLLADWLPGPLSLYLLWKRQPVKSLLIAIVPGVVTSFFILNAVDLEPYKNSPVGRYVKVYMTPQMQALRLAGQIVAWLGAWSRKPWLIVSGFVIILYGWFNGLIFPRSEA